jgi:integrase
MNYRISEDKENKVKILSVYQSKLMSVQESLRWKYIPLIFDEQTKIEEIVSSGEFKKPLGKTIKKYTENPNISAYGGRKGFVDLCLDRGQNFVDIAAWLGHKDTTTTFKHYKNKQLVRFNPVEKKNKGFKIVK